MTEARTILVVDDDAPLRERLAKALTERGYETHTAADHDEAVAVAQRHVIHRAIVDLRMPGKHGLAVVADLMALQPEMEIVVVTGYGSIATAVEAIRHGAKDYLTKPAHTDAILAAFDPGADAGPEPTFETPSLARLEWEHIERVLRECNGNISRAARVLGMHRRTLQYKLAKFPSKR